MESEKSQLRSGITSAFNKNLNEALQFSPQMPFNIENTVTPSQLIGVLKGEQGTPGLPAAISAVKDNNNLIMLATSPIRRGKITFLSSTLSIDGVANFDFDFTVPAGKKYLIKSVIGDASTAITATFSNTSKFLIYQGTTNHNLQFITFTGQTFNINIEPYSLLLSNAEYIRIRVTTSAHTITGNYTVKLLVEEIDI